MTWRKFLLVAILTFLLVETVALAVDVETVYVGKGRIYAQTNDGYPTIKPERPYIFEVAVRMTQTGAVTSARWSGPQLPVDAGAFLIQPTTKSPLLWYWIDAFSSQTFLDNIRPFGDYGVIMTTAHDGSRTNRCLFNSSSYPNAPQILNYDAAQSVDPASDFTLQWLGFANSGPDDIITFTIMEAGTNGRPGIVYETGRFPGAPGAVDGTQTSLTIPAGTLAPGRSYVGRLRFDNIIAVDSTNYPSELGLGAYFIATDFSITTIGADSNITTRIEAVYPPRVAVDIPRDAPLIWTFNKTMQRASSLSLTGFTTNRVSFWTTDQRSFVFLPLSPNPADTNVTWRLQPWAPFLLFGDLVGNPLFTDVNGAFHTGTDLLPAPAQPRLGSPTVSNNAVQMLLQRQPRLLLPKRCPPGMAETVLYMGPRG